jgi:hypothetical protein
VGALDKCGELGGGLRRPARASRTILGIPVAVICMSSDFPASSNNHLRTGTDKGNPTV